MSCPDGACEWEEVASVFALADALAAVVEEEHLNDPDVHGGAFVDCPVGVCERARAYRAARGGA